METIQGVRKAMPITPNFDFIRIMNRFKRLNFFFFLKAPESFEKINLPIEKKTTEPNHPPKIVIIKDSQNEKPLTLATPGEKANFTDEIKNKVIVFSTVYLFNHFTTGGRLFIRNRG